MKRHNIAIVVATAALVLFLVFYSNLHGEENPISKTATSSPFTNRVLIPAATTTPSLSQATAVAYKATPFPIEISKPTVRKISSIGNPIVTYDTVYSILSKIARCESGNDPTARNKTSSAKGLLQIVDGTWQAFSCDGSVLNADDNMRCGAKIALQSGLQHWSESRSCWIKLVENDTLADNRVQ